MLQDELYKRGNVNSIINNNRAGAVTPAESEDNMKYTYEELQIMLDETEKAFDVMKKFAEVNNEFLMREDVKPLYEKFLLDKLNK